VRSAGEPRRAPDPRAFADTSLTYEEQARRDDKFRRERQRAHADSMSKDMNQKVVLALHAVPAAARVTPAAVARLAHSCDSLVTAVPPGEWDIFLIAAHFDLLCALEFSFDFPEDWIVRGFTLSPELKSPFFLGGLKTTDRRACTIAFDCVAHPDRLKDAPDGVKHTASDIVVIGRLDIIATSPGSVSIADHPDPGFGQPDVVNSWNTSNDVPPAARGRVDVGRGPGAKPCAAGGSIASGLSSKSDKGGAR
jgi:hypothetical protein